MKWISLTSLMKKLGDGWSFNWTRGEDKRAIYIFKDDSSRRTVIIELDGHYKIRSISREDNSELMEGSSISKQETLLIRNLRKAIKEDVALYRHYTAMGGKIKMHYL